MLTALQLEANPGVWILEIQVRGRPLRFATERAEVPTESGDVQLYREGLENLELRLAPDGSADAVVPVEIDAQEDWQALTGAFVVVERAPVILRRWHPGQLLEQARVAISGYVQKFRYAEVDQPVGFNIVRRPSTVARLMPSSGMVVDEVTWPVRAGTLTDATVFGAYYQIVFGTPGLLGDGTIVPATEAYLVEADDPLVGGVVNARWLIAGHRVLATEVILFDLTDEAAIVSETLPVIHVQDGAGRWVAMVEEGSTVVPLEGSRYNVGWPGAGLYNLRNGGALQGAGDIIEWVYRTWTSSGLDLDRFASVRAVLNQYELGGWLNSPRDAVSWLRSNVMPLVPVDPVQGENGLWFRMRALEAKRHESLWTFDVDNGRLALNGEVEVQSEQLVNEVTIEYAPNRSTDTFRFRVVVGADNNVRPNDELQADLDTPDTRFVGNLRARLSQREYDRLPVTIQTRMVWLQSTAVRIGTDIINQQALPFRAATLTGGEEWAGVAENDVGVLHYAAVGMPDVVVRVVNVEVGGPDVVISLEIDDDPTTLLRPG